MSASPLYLPHSGARSLKQLKPFCGLRDIVQKHRISRFALTSAVVTGGSPVNDGAPAR
jgi:hypothetical protein